MWDFVAKIFPTLFEAATRSKKNSDEIKVVAARVDVLAQSLARLESSVEARFAALEKRQEAAEAQHRHAQELHRAEMRELVLRLENILLRNGIDPGAPGNRLPQSPRD